MNKDEEFIRHLLNELSENRWVMWQFSKTQTNPSRRMMFVREVEILDNLVEEIKEHLTNTPST